MFGKHKKRSPNILFVIFRLILSLTMFAVLLAGLYTAYKHFSGLDPLKLDPNSIIRSVLGTKSPKDLLDVVKIGQDKIIPSQTNETTTNSKVVFKFLLVADSHSDNQNLKKAIQQTKDKYPDISFIIGLGDYTDVGTLKELKDAKAELDSSGLRYFLVAGDHDLWDSRDKGIGSSSNFRQVFGPTFQSFTFENFRFLLLHNSDNYKGLSEDEQSWLSLELEKLKDEKVAGVFAFAHEPLYHPSSDHYMGKVEKSVKVQAESLIFQLKEAGVKKVFSGDTHFFSQYEEPVTKLPMATVGALVTDRNPQLPRFAVVSIFEDGSSRVEDIELGARN